MSIGTFELEHGVLPESGFASEAFFENVVQAARGGAAYRPLSLLAMRAARAALVEGQKESEGELEGIFEAETEWEISPASLEQTFAAGESAANTALMAHLGHAAAEAESDGEAFAFLAPLAIQAVRSLAPMAMKVGAKLLPKAASAVSKLAPKLLNSAKAATKTLRNAPNGKQLVQAMPDVMKHTAAHLTQQAAAGKPIHPQGASKVMAQVIMQLLGNPQRLLSILHRNRQHDRRFHRGSATATCRCS